MTARLPEIKAKYDSKQKEKIATRDKIGKSHSVPKGQEFKNVMMDIECARKMK